MNKFLIGAATATALFATVGSANATTYILNLGNAGLAGFSGPFGSVDVTLDTSTTATVTFTSDISGASGYLYYFGDGGTAGVNTNGSATISNITGDSLGTYSDGGSGNEDGFGNFSDTINTSDGFHDKSHVVSFDLTLSAGTWASADDVLKGNALGNPVAAHIFIANLNGTNTNVTGFATVGGVPEPSTWMLMIAGFGLIGFALRRRPATKAEGAFA